MSHGGGDNAQQMDARLQQEAFVTPQQADRQLIFFAPSTNTCILGSGRCRNASDRQAREKNTPQSQRNSPTGASRCARTLAQWIRCSRNVLQTISSSVGPRLRKTKHPVVLHSREDDIRAGTGQVQQRRWQQFMLEREPNQRRHPEQVFGVRAVDARIRKTLEEIVRDGMQILDTNPEAGQRVFPDQPGLSSEAAICVRPFLSSVSAPPLPSPSSNFHWSGPGRACRSFGAGG